MTDLAEERDRPMKTEEKLTLAFIIVLSLSISAYSITDTHLLSMNSYSELILAKDAVSGTAPSPTPLLYQLTAFIYQTLNSNSIVFNPNLMVSIAKALAVIFSLVCVVSFYFMLRSMFSEIAAAGGAILLASSRAFNMVMMAGIYGADALGMCTFAVACCMLFLFYKRKSYPLLIVSAVFFIISGVSWNAGLTMIGITFLSLLAQLAYDARKKFDETLAHGTAVVFVTILVSYFIVPYQNIFTSINTSNLIAYIFETPFAVIGVFAFISWMLGKHQRRGELGIFAASFFVLSLAVLLFHYFPASFGIALFCAFAINELLELKNEMLALILFAASIFFVSFMLCSEFMDLYQTLLASAGVAATSVFIASLYREKRIVPYIAFSVIMLFLISSVSSAMISASQNTESVGPGADGVVAWVNENLPKNASIWAFSISPFIEFSTGRKSYSNDTEFASFMLSNESTSFLKEKNVTFILADSSLFDDINVLKILANNTRVRIDSFRFYTTASDGVNTYGVFVSVDGNTAYVQVDPISGKLSGDTVEIINRDQTATSVSLNTFLTLGSGRLIYPQDNYKVNLFMMFFGQVNGLKTVYSSTGGEIKIFEVSA